MTKRFLGLGAAAVLLLCLAGLGAYLVSRNAPLFAPSASQPALTTGEMARSNPSSESAPVPALAAPASISPSIQLPKFKSDSQQARRLVPSHLCSEAEVFFASAPAKCLTGQGLVPAYPLGQPFPLAAPGTPPGK